MKGFRFMLRKNKFLLRLHPLLRPTRSRTKIRRRDWVFTDVWKDPSIPVAQSEVVEPQIERFRGGGRVPEFETLCRSFEGLEKHTTTSVLEIGCSTGYNLEVIHSQYPNVRAVGIDYSAAFIDAAKKKYQDTFLVGDATALPFRSRTFDVVVSGSVLLHVLNWVDGLNESCRVAKQRLILHRTPVSTEPSQLFKKVAYGVEMGEWIFSDTEIVEAVTKSGFFLRERLFVYGDSQISPQASNPTNVTYIFDCE